MSRSTTHTVGRNGQPFYAITYFTRKTRQGIQEFVKGILYTPSGDEVTATYPVEALWWVTPPQSVVLRVSGRPLPVHLDEVTVAQLRSNVRGFNPTAILPADWEA